MFIVATAVFCLVGPDAPQGGDTVPNRYLAAGFWCGDHTLDRYSALWGGNVDRPAYYATRTINGDLVSTFGPAVPWLSAPFFAVFKVAGIRSDFSGILHAGRLTAGLLCAIATLLVFLSCTRVAGWRASVLGAAAFAFGSAVLTIASRGLWQHTWSLPLLAGGILFFLKSMEGPDDWKAAALCGILLSLSFAVRPQTGLFLAAAVIAGTAAGRRTVALSCLASAFPVLAGIAAYNTWHFDSPFTFAQTLRSVDVAFFKTGSASLVSARPWEGLAAILASPSRGILVLSPVFVFAIGGVSTMLRGRTGRDASEGDDRGTIHALRWLSLAALGLIVVASLWFDWWGGYTVSYRPIIEILPMVGILTAIGLERWKRPLARGLYVVLMAWSMSLGLLTVTHPGIVAWNEEVDVDHHPGRVWDIGSSLPARALEARPDDRTPMIDCLPVGLVDCEVVEGVVGTETDR